MENTVILWADDEIDLLKPHVYFLEEKGYTVLTFNNGDEAIDKLKTTHVDIVFLDENMPGLSGIQTLSIIKSLYPQLPVIMITKSEEEHIMDDAIGSSISDYLIKPVNPKQILLSVKKNLENKRLISEKTSFAYQQEFRNLGMTITPKLDFNDWYDVYKKLVYWELELDKTDDAGILEVMRMQKSEANNVFCKFVEKNYIDWLTSSKSEKPVLSHTLAKEKIFPLIKQHNSLFFILIDNLRFDQWKTIQPILEQYYRVENEDMYYSILPTTTQYARNALFAGLLPSEIDKKYPKLWIDEDEEGTKNQFEEELFNENLKRYGIDIKTSYTKVLNLSSGKKLVDSLPNLLNYNFNTIVYNFVDMLSHARTEMEVIRELANDEPAYRSLTLSWFEHSPLFEIIKFLAEKKIPIIISTDHGSIKVNNPVKIIGDRNTNTNLRYKTGKSLSYNKNEVFEIRKPAEAFLPKTNLSSTFAFCRSNDFFAYPNNYNYYVNYYKNTFQHGGISLEEVLIPFIFMQAK